MNSDGWHSGIPCLPTSIALLVLRSRLDLLAQATVVSMEHGEMWPEPFLVMCPCLRILILFTSLW